MKLLRSIFLIMNLKALIAVSLSLISTYVCLHFNLIAEVSQSIIAIAVVFPIVFSIGGAYTRRETALRDYSNIKAHSRSIYLASRDWLEPANPALKDKSKVIIKDILISVRTLFLAKSSEREEKEKAVYKQFSELSLYIKDVRNAGLASGEVSRLNQYLSKMAEAFENMKHVYQYRTPITLRAYSKIFVFLVPILYGPYFAHEAKDLYWALGVINPLLFSLVLVSLDNIQDHLENPFDQVGEDDIKINAEKFVKNLDIE